MSLGREHFGAPGRATSGHRLIEVAGGPQRLKNGHFWEFSGFFWLGAAMAEDHRGFHF